MVCVRVFYLERYAGLGIIRVTRYTVSLLTQRVGNDTHYSEKQWLSSQHDT